ncbi:hypothetical protein IHE70_01585 [Streptomyces sp. ID-01-6.2a]|uniref:Uncharacterized protein n=1 Tax=Streptomyces caniscabiei TaxID=2746961 RepID=A0A927KZ64_9ACTN|nr:hypothetical protein [Streptomyces caniscabiei]
MPEPPAAPAAGQAANPLTDSVVSAAVEHALQQTFHRDDSPIPSVGTAPPVPQPGRPPMSQGATDASVLMLSGGVATVLVGGATSLVMIASGHADPVVCAIVLGAPTALALAIGRVLSRAKNVLPDEIHQTYTGTVYQDQRNVHTKNTGVWAKTSNRSH